MGEISSYLAGLLIQTINSYGLLAVFLLMLAESALIPIPSEITMPFAGFLAGRGDMNIWLAVLAGASGNLAGSLIAYYLGFFKGEEWVRLGIRRWGKWLLLSEEEFDRSKRWFLNYGQSVTFISRLLPVVRTFISLPAGISKMNIKSFTFLTFFGSLLWSGVLAYLGLKLGQNWLSIEPYFRKFQIVIIGLFGAGVAFYLWTHIRRRRISKN